MYGTDKTCSTETIAYIPVVILHRNRHCLVSILHVYTCYVQYVPKECQNDTCTNLYRVTLSITRMHSSRMRTARSLTVSRRIPCTPPQQPHPPPATTHTPVATTHAPSATMHAPPRNHQPCTPPSVDRITDACENITLPQLRCGR